MLSNWSLPISFSFPPQIFPFLPLLVLLIPSIFFFHQNVSNIKYASRYTSCNISGIGDIKVNKTFPSPSKLCSSLLHLLLKCSYSQAIPSIYELHKNKTVAVCYQPFFHFPVEMPGTSKTLNSYLLNK